MISLSFLHISITAHSIRMFVRLSNSLHISKSIVQSTNITKFSVHVIRGHGSVLLVLPVSWMTSRFLIMGPVALGLGNGRSGHQVGLTINFQRIPQVAPPTLFNFVVVQI